MPKIIVDVINNREREADNHLVTSIQTEKKKLNFHRFQLLLD